MKIKDVFEKSVQFLKDKKIETARLDSELLLAHALKIERVQIYMKYEQPLSEIEIQNCREVLRRRGLGEAVAYITGEKGFFGENFSVGAGVLVPRPETEMVVEEALKFIKQKNLKAPRILDLGAGTGCIGFSILKNCVEASLISVEKSEEAFKYLKQNQEKLELTGRSELLNGDVVKTSFTACSFDIIVANPPYISVEDSQVETSVRKFEPHEALFAADSGYRDLFGWSRHVAVFLKTPGLMLFEMGHEQGKTLKGHFENLKQFSEIKILKDLSGLDRVIKSTQ